MSNTLLNKNQAGDGIWTADNLIAGTNISITQVEKPVIDENTITLMHFDNNFHEEIKNVTYSITGTFVAGKFDKAITSTRNTWSFNNAISTGNNSYTVEAWIAPSGNTNQSYFILGGTTSTTIVFNPSGSTNEIIMPSSYSGKSSEGYASYPAGFTYQANVFFHVAYVITPTNIYLFINGKNVYNETRSSSSYPNYIQPAIGGFSTAYYEDEFRVSNIARWTEDFTPYSEPYGPAGGPAQYQINNTKADPDLSSYLQNTATMNTSLTVAGVATTSDSNTNIGKSSAAYGADCTVIGKNAKSGVARDGCANSTLVGADTSATGGGHNVVIGYGSQTTCPTMGRGIAIGSSAKVSADYAIQLGSGTNSTANTFQVFSTTVVDANGKIPMSSTDVTSLTGYDATKTQVLKNVNGTLTWVDEA